MLRELGVATAVVVAMVMLVGPPPAAGYEPSEEDESCFACHDDPGLESDGAQPKPLHVDPQTFGRSIHAENGCTSCHQDIDVDDLPHDSPLEPVDCSGCHDGIGERYARSSHGKALARGDKDAPRCDDCHSKHSVRPRSDPNSWTNISNVPRLCGACHREDSDMVGRHHIGQQNVLRNYSMSIHGEGLFRRGLTVTAVCTSCHTAHDVLPHESNESTIHRDNIAGTCLQCHGQIEQVHEKVIRGELWEKQPALIPACVECHAPHEIRRVRYEDTLDDAYCMSCHGQTELTRTVGDEVDSLFVDRSELFVSAHGAGTPCVRCHVSVDIRSDPVCLDSGPVDCSICHAEEVVDYGGGIHGRLNAEGDPNAPECRDCHGTHEIRRLNDLESAVFPRNVPTLCGRCHREGQAAAVRHPGEERVEHYEMSIHGKGLRESGLMVTAVCSSCHTAHRELPAADPGSSVNRDNVAQTCAQCHLGIFEEFKSSVHSAEVTTTDKALPACNDCHSSHEIERVDLEDFRQQILQQCGDCHHDVTETYFETYHGKVSLLGYGATAKCSDCHGSHAILPPEDPHSTLSRGNIVETCKTCHPESNRKFTGYLTHATHHDKVKYPILFYTFWGMTTLLIGTFGFFGVHTLLWFPRSLWYRRRLARQSAEHREPTFVAKSALTRSAGAKGVGGFVMRFEAFPRILHIMVIVSFLGLAATGMVLKFASQEWAVTLAHFLGGFESAGAIHRFCAILTFAYFVLHFVHVRNKKKESGQSLLRFILDKHTSMVPHKRDFVEFGQTMKWFVGRGPRPSYGRWTYWEKFDYMAVFWGVAMIGSTGLVLWFPELFTRFLPGVLINVATIIHSDEALLATGFIFTVHFFNTHFRPEKFPMDPVIFTGVVPLDEFKDDRPREYAELMRTGKLRTLMRDGPPRWLWWAGRIFGFTALTIGLVLVLMIVWSMVFQYR